eukprot:scaffold153823_cov20-Prasinocladus_malaysianus.AAC.1
MLTAPASRLKTVYKYAYKLIRSMTANNLTHAKHWLWHIPKHAVRTQVENMNTPPGSTALTAETKAKFYLPMASHESL